MSGIKKIILMDVPMSICNFRCHYCYLAQQEECYQGIQPKMKYSPSEVASALSCKRIGGQAFINICAAGETLLTKDIDLYVKALVEEGHYVELVTNLTVTSVLEKFLLWDTELLKHLEFKCSFHYLELKRTGLLETFSSNVKKIWDAGASANIEITPSDELIPYIDEVKRFSYEEFGALPHLTIARDDRTESIDYLTKMSDSEYENVWSSFDSDFWRFKRSIFGKKQKGFCYAGSWSIYVDISTGMARQCYCGRSLGDVFKNPDEPLPDEPIGMCEIAHCYNGHALLTMGLIPGVTNVRYGDIRDRRKTDGGCWLQPELKDFFNSKCQENNKQLRKLTRELIMRKKLIILFTKKQIRQLYHSIKQIRI